MPKDWIAIRRARPDISDYLLHWTRGRATDDGRLTPFDVLKEILRCGYVRPTFAPKESVTAGGKNNTIKGPHPAVCLTEQPLEAFLESCKVLPQRYERYALALHKWHLFSYGGRPVIYGDDGQLERLQDDDKYLWVRYSPIPEVMFGNFPIDWTHEREWRAKHEVHEYADIGQTPPNGVPLLLPPVTYPKSGKPVLSLPRVLVKTTEERDEIAQWIRELPAYDGDNGVLQRYFAILPSIMVIPLDHVEEHVRGGDVRYAHLETLPYEEIDPSFSMPTPEEYV